MLGLKFVTSFSTPLNIYCLHLLQSVVLKLQNIYALYIYGIRRTSNKF
jgi:hypothetical protein